MRINIASSYTFLRLASWLIEYCWVSQLRVRHCALSCCPFLEAVLAYSLNPFDGKVSFWYYGRCLPRYSIDIAMEPWMYVHVYTCIVQCNCSMFLHRIDITFQILSPSSSGISEATLWPRCNPFVESRLWQPRIANIACCVASISAMFSVPVLIFKKPKFWRRHLTIPPTHVVRNRAWKFLTPRNFWRFGWHLSSHRTVFTTTAGGVNN